MEKLNVSPDDGTFLQQSSCPEVGSDESSNNQIKAEITVLKEEKAADSQNKELDLEPNKSEDNATANTTTGNGINAGITVADNLTTENLVENQTTVTS